MYNVCVYKEGEQMISVAMASYNGEKYIEQQLDSIFNQSKKIDELIITDDCSTDNTVFVIEEYIKKHPNFKIYLIKNKNNLGYKKNFYKALSYCKGDYIFLCDQDDIWLEEKVETMIGIMNDYPQIKALASSFQFIDKDNNPKEVELIPTFSNNNLYRRIVKKDDLVKVLFDEMLIQNGFQGCALCITKEMNQIFLKCFTDELFHDWLINLLASSRNGLYFYNHPLFLYRIHDNNTIGINKSENLTETERLKKTNTLHVRSLFAQSSINSINILERMDKELEENQPDYKKKRDFYKNHIDYLKKGNPIKLLFQNFSPYYKNIKTNKARVMDIFFAIRQRLV